MKYTLILSISICTLAGVYAQIPDSIFLPEVVFSGDQPDWLHVVKDETKLGVGPAGNVDFSISQYTAIDEMSSIVEDDKLYSVYESSIALKTWGPLLIGLDMHTGDEVLYKSFNPSVLKNAIVPNTLTIRSDGDLQIMGARCKLTFDSLFNNLFEGCSVFGAGAVVKMVVNPVSGSIVDTTYLLPEEGGLVIANDRGAPDVIEFAEDSLYLSNWHLGADEIVIKTDLLNGHMEPLDTSKYVFASYDVGDFKRVPEVVKVSDTEVVALVLDSRFNWFPNVGYGSTELIWYDYTSEVKRTLRIDSMLINPSAATSMMHKEGKLIITARSVANFGQTEPDVTASVVVLDAITGEILGHYPRLKYDQEGYGFGITTSLTASDKLIFVGVNLAFDRIDILSLNKDTIELLKSTEINIVAEGDASFTPRKLFITDDGYLVAKCRIEVQPSLGSFNIDLGYDLSGALTSTEVLSEPTTFELYPNPASDYIQLSGGGAEEVRLATMQGQLVRTYRDQDVSRLEVSDLPEGPYVCTIRAEDGSVETHKLMVMR